MSDERETPRADLWLVVETPLTFDWQADAFPQLFGDEQYTVQTFYPRLQVVCITPAFTLLTMKIPAVWGITRGGPLGTLVRIQEEGIIKAIQIVPPRQEER